MGLLLLHAHPDDESIGTGGTMARYAAEGVRVTLVTCTLGEMGEIIPAALAHLTPEELGQYRIGELKAACEALGVRDQRFLGRPGRWRDSGMMGTPANADPRCFWHADVAEAAAMLAEVIDEVAPEVIVTYDANGFYGHPDHIQAHRVAWRAYQLACDPARTSFYATAAPDGEAAAVKVDVGGYLPAKFAAMRAHTTQIIVSEPRFALSNGVWEEVYPVECYTLLAGPGGGESSLLPR
ncbi:MAG TPA: N-acetyl-1-D-myo-inositol-2-amino-2-deoxy-alpha-D-glucopyranoside deacetylase [Streptosporangiaceae bacterium]